MKKTKRATGMVFLGFDVPPELKDRLAKQAEYEERAVRVVAVRALEMYLQANESRDIPEKKTAKTRQK